MVYYANWESLTGSVKRKVSKTLSSSVRPVVEKLVLRHIFSDVYGVYAPKSGAWVTSDGKRGGTYQRRYSLLEEGNLYNELQYNGTTLMVTSKATPSPAIVKGSSFHNRRPGAFLSLLESGNMGIWRGGFARPAISEAQAEIDEQLGSEDSDIGRAIMRGLTK